MKPIFKSFYHRISLICSERAIDLAYCYNYLARHLPYKFSKSLQTFTLQKETYSYFFHKYNLAWRNERAVEVSIIWRAVKVHQGQKILEVGNVLSHYFPVNHDICDKHEKAKGVINQDIINFQPASKYDLIVSISTLEHVGWDENPREHMAILKAIENLKELLAPEGQLLVTLPIGYNPMISELITRGAIQFTKMYCMKRISKRNKWIETSWDDISDVKYDQPFPSANGLVIGIIEKKTS